MCLTITKPYKPFKALHYSGGESLRTFIETADHSILCDTLRGGRFKEKENGWKVVAKKKTFASWSAHSLNALTGIPSEPGSFSWHHLGWQWVPCSQQCCPSLFLIHLKVLKAVVEFLSLCAAAAADGFIFPAFVVSEVLNSLPCMLGVTVTKLTLNLLLVGCHYLLDDSLQVWPGITVQVPHAWPNFPLMLFVRINCD